MTAKEYRKELADSFIHVLKEKKLDWKKEWEDASQIPANGVSGYRYRGLNRFYLMLMSLQRGYKDPRWCTFKQIAYKGWRLENAKGQGVKVEYWFPYDTLEKRSLTWQEFRALGGDFTKERYILRAVYRTVFNASLIRGIPEFTVAKHPEIAPDALIRKLSESMGVEIINDGGDRAYYRPSEDKIHLPLPETFDTQYAYDSTALHELAHATGAAHRLNRSTKNIFGSQEYAFEELIAEISSCFMSVDLPVMPGQSSIDNHRAYVQNWIEAMEEKPETLVRAVQQAEKAAAYMEYKAGLIEREEYERTLGSSMEADVPEAVSQGDAADIVLERKEPEKNRMENQDDRQIEAEMHMNYDLDKSDVSLVAYGWITLNEAVKFPVTVRKYPDRNTGETKMFISYPQRRTEEGYVPVVYPNDAALKKQIEDAVFQGMQQSILRDKYKPFPQIECQVTRLEDDGSHPVALRGIATIKLLGLTVKGILIKEGERGLFIKMPQHPSYGGYKDTIYGITRSAQNQIKECILEEFKKQCVPKHEPQKPAMDGPKVR